MPSGKRGGPSARAAGFFGGNRGDRSGRL